MRELIRLMGYLKRNLAVAVMAYATLLFSTRLNVAVPWVIKQAIDVGLGAMDHRYLTLAAVAIVAITVVKGFFSFWQNYLAEYLSQRSASDLRNDLYAHLQRLGFDFHDRSQTGDLMTRVTSDVEVARQFVGFALVNLLSTSLLFCAVTAILFSLNWVLALLSLGTMPALVLITVHLARRVRPMFKKVQEQLGKTTTVLQENIAGVRIVRAFAQEEREIERFDQANWALLLRNLETSRLWAVSFPMMTFVTGLGVALILWYGGTQVVNGAMTVGTLVAFTAYLAMLAGPVRQLGWMVNLSARSAASGQRIFEVMDTPPSIVDAPSAIHLPRAQGRVCFENVSFSYEGTAPVLRDVDLVTEPGMAVALVGPVGCGKSTLANLVPRFYDVTSGRVTIDGHDVRDVTLNSLRRQVGVVLQEPILFSGTVRENIAYGRPDASLDDVIAAAKVARAHDFIVDLAEGYDARIGERGVNLSGGQKQRLCIARALVIDPRVLIFDDSTSSVDSETERLIQTALDELMVGRTTFIITHRLHTARRADLILVLERGRIVERGSHWELLRRNGLYARVYQLQLAQRDDPAERETRDEGLWGEEELESSERPRFS